MSGEPRLHLAGEEPASQILQERYGGDPQEPLESERVRRDRDVEPAAEEPETDKAVDAAPAPPALSEEGVPVEMVPQ